MEPKTVGAASLLTFGGAATAIYVFWRTWKNSEVVPKMITKNEEEIKLQWEFVGKVVNVFVYPVKSCKAVSAQTAEADRLGLLYNGVRDRSFIIVSEKGTPITGRTAPTTVLIQATFENNILTLNFPHSKELQVDICHVAMHGEQVKTDIWGKNVNGFDCGKDASQWLQRNLKRKCKLLYYADLPTSRVSEHPLKHMLRKGDDHSLYADFTAYMLMTSESIADLQCRVSPKVAAITAEDFRPNILVEGVQKPYDEDEWQCIKIGGAIFRNVVPCTRCIFANVSARTGEKNRGMEPLRTLKTYRCREGSNDPYLGINLVLYVAGEVSVGDEVFVTRRSITTEDDD